MGRQKPAVREHLLSINGSSSSSYDGSVPPVESIDMTFQEKIQYAAELFSIGGAQGLTSYFNFKTMTAIADNQVLFSMLVALYATISTASSGYMLYQLGPYHFNVVAMQNEMSNIRKNLQELGVSENKLRFELQNISDQLALLAREKKWLLPEKNKHHKKNKLNSDSENEVDYSVLLKFGLNILTGVFWGRNVNFIANIAGLGGYNVIAPILFGLGHAALNYYLMSSIINNKFFIPSDLAVNHALRELKLMSSSLENIKYQSRAKHTLVNAELKDKMEVVRHELKLDSLTQLASEQKAKSNLLFSSIDMNDEHKTIPQSRCANGFYATVSLLPMVLSFINMAVAERAANTGEDKNYSLFITVVIMSVIALSLLAMRIKRYHHPDVSELMAYSYFTKEGYKQKITDLQGRFQNDTDKLSMLSHKVSDVVKRIDRDKNNQPDNTDEKHQGKGRGVSADSQDTDKVSILDKLLEARGRAHSSLSRRM